MFRSAKNTGLQRFAVAMNSIKGLEMNLLRPIHFHSRSSASEYLPSYLSSFLITHTFNTMHISAFFAASLLTTALPFAAIAGPIALNEGTFHSNATTKSLNAMSSPTASFYSSAPLTTSAPLSTTVSLNSSAPWSASAPLSTSVHSGTKVHSSTKIHSRTKVHSSTKVSSRTKVPTSTKVHSSTKVFLNTSAPLSTATPLYDLGKRDDNARLTYYDITTGTTACGKNYKASDYVVALDGAEFGSGYPGPHCFKQISITANGKTATAQIVDKCPGCPKGGLDLTEGLFEHFAPTSVGVLTGSWKYV
ncbi:hypothetical protein DFH11DRAFT_313762 [Phellopilus nigrolimitatus]|nr:hypothetical protein DFH11DRAFT_313762 [Phellopilus nigrolimitatus]